MNRPIIDLMATGKMRTGFTLMEMILVVTILGILTAMSMPAIGRYMQQRDVQLEQNRLTEIRNA